MSSLIDGSCDAATVRIFHYHLVVNCYYSVQKKLHGHFFFLFFNTEKHFEYSWFFSRENREEQM